MVDGKPDTIAVPDFKYDSEKGTLVHEVNCRVLPKASGIILKGPASLPTHRRAFPVGGERLSGRLLQARS